jgi:superfamily II DNA or RNA helicase
MAASGPVGIKVTEKMLIDRGILARPYFKHIQLYGRTKYLTMRLNWPSAYRIGVVENVQRNTVIVEEAKKANEHGLSVMCLVNQKNHGRILKEMMTKAGLRAAFIFGENDAKERKQKLDELKNKEIDVLIGSTILDVGVDVPAVGMVILAGAGKAEVAIRQRIGRGLRAKKSGPNVCFIVDFEDGQNKHLIDHAVQRRLIIAQTPGFNEGMVNEFPYHLFKKD